jgi:hypothetical protein
VAQLGLGLVLVERQAVGAQDDVDGLPLLRVLAYWWWCGDVVMGCGTLVFRVRFSTGPALIMRSNSKQPFWLTGDMTVVLSACAWAWAWMLARRGCAGVLSFIFKGVRATGLAGVCCAPSAMAAASLHQVAGNRGGSCGVGVVVVEADYISAAMMEAMRIYRRATGGMHERVRSGSSRSTVASSSGQRYRLSATRLQGSPGQASQSGEVRLSPGPGPLETLSGCVAHG